MALKLRMTAVSKKKVVLKLTMTARTHKKLLTLRATDAIKRY